MKHYLVYVENGHTVYAGDDENAARRAYKWAVKQFQENPKRSRRKVILCTV